MGASSRFLRRGSFSTVALLALVFCGAHTVLYCTPIAASASFPAAPRYPAPAHAGSPHRLGLIRR